MVQAADGRGTGERQAIQTRTAGKLVGSGTEWAGNHRRLVFGLSACLKSMRCIWIACLPSMFLPHLQYCLAKMTLPWLASHFGLHLSAFPWCVRIVCLPPPLPAPWTGDQHPYAMQAADAAGYCQPLHLRCLQYWPCPPQLMSVLTRAGVGLTLGVH